MRNSVLPHIIASARVIALSLALDVLAFSSVLGGRDPVRGIQVLAVLLYATLGLSLLAWRKDRPVLVFGLLVLHAVVAPVACPGYHPTVGVLVALHAVSEARSPSLSLPLAAAALLPDVPAVAQAARQSEPGRAAGTIVISVVGYAVMTLSAWALGRWSRLNRSLLEESERRRVAEVELEKVQAVQAVSMERANIAREMHDIVANSVTVMVIHSGSAARWLEKDVVRARSSLQTIEATGRQAADELRRMLRVLSHVGSGVEVEHRLADLPELAESFRGAGLSVTLRTSGSVRDLAPSVDLAAYRVAQEALTNSLRHSGPGTATEVTSVWTSDSLVLKVRDDGGGTPDPRLRDLSSGHGLLGLRERVAVSGGDLETRDLGRSGFELVARLPFSESATPLASASSRPAAGADRGVPEQETAAVRAVAPGPRRGV